MYQRYSEEERKRRGKSCSMVIYIIGGIICLLIIIFFAMSIAGGSSQKTEPTAASAPLGAAPETQAEPTTDPRLLIRYESDGQCLIKGNISQGEKIYHVPSSTSYDTTKIDISAGERWFCTEAEAIAAGWHAPGQ